MPDFPHFWGKAFEGQVEYWKLAQDWVAGVRSRRGSWSVVGFFKASLKVVFVILGLALIKGIISLVATFVEAGGDVTKFSYSVKYNVSPDKIQVDSQPSDCDFMHAPLGYKGCYYKKVVTAYNAQGTPIRGDGAPRYSHDVKTNRPIVSWDDGKTWEWASNIPDQTIQSVTVTWLKETD